MIRVFRSVAERRARRERWRRTCSAVDIVVSAPWDPSLQSQILLLAIRDPLREFRPEDEKLLFPALLDLCDGLRSLESEALHRLNFGHEFWRACQECLGEAIRHNLHSRGRLPLADEYSTAAP